MSSPRYIRKRCYKEFNPINYVQAVQQVNWLDLYLAEDVDEAVSILSTKLTDTLDVMAPMKTIQARKNYVPWISQETLHLIKHRQQLHKLASETRDVIKSMES